MTLTLDVLTNVDYKKIEAEVEKIKSNLKKIPQKVTIDIDVGLAKDAAKKIENVQASIEGVVRSMGASTVMKSTARDIDAVAQSAANMGQTTSTALRDQIDALTGVSSQAKSARDSADAMKMAWAMQAEEARKAADETRKLKQAQEQAAAAQKKSLTVLKSSEKGLRDWTKAQTSSNESSRAAYANLQNAVAVLKNARQNYDGSAASVRNLESATRNANSVLRETEVVLNRNGDASRTLSERITGLAAKFTSWLTVSQAVMLGIRSVRNMAKEAVSVNEAMTQLRIVTNESEEAYKQYGDSVAKTSQKISASMTDIIDATTTFARLGYSLSEASSLAELTAMLQKVGDIEAEDAQAALTSIIKAFDVDVKDMESVMDKLVTVGNNFPISVSEIATGMTNASSALAAAGNDFNKSVALLAAANTTIQNADKSSTGLRTITARLRKTKGELDDLGESMTESAYADLVGALTKHNVALQDANGEYRDTYDIMKDIAAVWDTMSSSEQAALAELAAGNRQQTIFYSIIENFDVAQGAMKDMEKSAGALRDAYDEWLSGASAHIEKFKAAFQGLSTDLFTGDFLTTFIDIGTAIINIIDGLVKLIDKIGGLKTALLGISGIVAIIKADAIATSLTTLGTKLFSFISILGAVPGKLSTLRMVMKNFKSDTALAVPGTSKLSVALKTLGISASSAQIAMTGLVAVIGTIAAINNAIDNAESAAREKLQTSYDNAMSGSEKGNLYDLYKQYESAKEAIDGSATSKEALESATRSLCTALGLEGEAIDSVKDKLKDLTEAELQKAIDDANVAIVSAQKMLVGNMDTWRDSTEKGTIDMWAAASGIDIYGDMSTEQRAANLIKVYDILVAKRKELIDAGQTDTIGYTNIDAAISLLTPDINRLTSAQEGLATATSRYNDVVNPTADAIDDAASSAEDAAERLKEASDKTVKVIEGITNAQKLLTSQDTGKSISIGDFTAEVMEDYASALEYVNGVYQLNAEKVRDIIEAKTQEQIAVNDANKAYAQSEYLKNAKQIEKYREELKKAEKANDGTADSIRESINKLLEENAALKADCAQYDLMSASLAEVTNAYQNWLNAKNASQSGDMFDDALAAIKQIDDVLNNTKSDLYGRVGRSDYKAAIDFIVPDSVDAEDSAAVNAYMDSIKEMFTFDKDGNRTGLNIENFIKKSLDAGLIAINDAGTAYEIAGGKTMEDFANGLGLSLPLVRAMFGELEEFGAKFDWSDEATKTIGDLGVAAYEAAEGLRSIDQFKDLKIVMDVSDFDDVDKACETLETTIKQMQNIKLNLDPNVDQEQFKQANDIIQYCIAQKQLLSAPAIMSVDVSKVTSEIAPALDLLQQFQNAQNTLEMNAAIGADTSQAEAEIDSIVAQIQGLDPEILTKIGLDPTSEESIKTYISGLDAEAIISFGVDSSLVDAYQKATKTAKGVVNWYDNTANLSKSFSRVGYVYWKDANNPSGGGDDGSSGTGSGGGRVNGTANVYGTARLRGDWRARGGRSLVGELGREIIVDPNTGRWYTVGDNGAEFVNIPDGAIVFNHLQSDALLENGRVSGRGRAMALGSAFVTGSIPIGIGGGNGGGSNYRPPSSGANSSVEDNYSKELETFDWIEVAIDRIERIIDRFSKTASSAFKSLATRVNATGDEISMITQEISLQKRAYDKYMSAAEAVSLSSDLKQLVRNGAIDISQYDQDTQKLINDYKELYEKALDCSASIDDLHESLAQLYKDNFDNVQKDFENKLSLMEKRASVYNTKIDKLEEQGYLKNATYYKQLQNTQKSSIGVLNQELQSLQNALTQAIGSGEIEEGSEAWYEMQFAIEDTKAAIEEAELAVIKYDNAIREIGWEYFDYAQERIGQIASEADFLLNLLDGKDMYDENGNLSDAGIAANGVHAEKYGIYMAQADKYAEEIKRINKELANDPNNTKLIKRRDELVASQRDAILAAKSEKEAMVDLAKNGINAELEAVKKLIDAYTESLDSAKDLYDYQKKIADKTEKITDLEKQLAAYQNDLSEETRSKIQKIQIKLEDAKNDLKETEYERLISDSKKMLDDLYSEYESVLNSRFDDIDATFEKMIALTNENFVSINEYLSQIANGVGYTISDDTNSVWSNGGGVNGFVSVYGEDITSKLTATGIVVENIFGVLEAIAKQNGVPFTGKSYASGGLIDYTGVANVHGSANKPEMVLNSDDTKNFIKLRDILRDVGMSSQIGSPVVGLPGIAAVSSNNGVSVGEINITIPIEKVEDYNDFVNQLRSDSQFEKLVQEITIGRLAGKSKLSKNKFNW